MSSATKPARRLPRTHVDSEEVRKARQDLWLKLRDEGMTYEQIGVMFDGRDHSSICYGVQKAVYRRANEPLCAARQLVHDSIDLCESVDQLERVHKYLRGKAI